MAAGKKVEEPAEGEAKKGGGLKLVLILLAGLVVAGGGGAAAWFLGLFGGGKSEAAAAAQGAHPAEGHGAATPEPAAPQVAFVDLPDILVNLKSTDKRPRFLKLKVALEVKDARTADQVKLLTPRILDGFQLYLRALTPEEIQGSNGMLTLKEELLARINQAVAPSRIADVLLKEILVQ